MRLARTIVTLTTLLLVPACAVDEPDPAARSTGAGHQGATDVDCFDDDPPPPACRAEGESCYATSDCCAGLCNGGQCVGVCTPGTTAPCYSGPAGTDGVGTCHAGTQVCNPYGTGWSGCMGEVLPAAEVCDSLDTDCDGDPTDGCGGGECVPAPELCGDAIDNDCDGQTDETCVCAPGAQIPCYDGPPGTGGVGACASGTATCNAEGTGYGACAGAITPLPETCGDGLDNDCDGVVDDGCVCVPDEAAACYTGPAGTEGVGNCRAGERTCRPDGMGYGACVGEVTPQAAACGDGIDDDADCDGVVDPPCGLGGRVWIDVSGDSTERNDDGDPEPRGPVTTFVLRHALTGALIAIANSDDVNGDYFFQGVPLGTYYIEAVLAFPWEPVAQDVGDDTIDNDFEPATSRTANFVYLGGHLVDIDLGLLSST